MKLKTRRVVKVKLKMKWVSRRVVKVKLKSKLVSRRVVKVKLKMKSRWMKLKVKVKRAPSNLASWKVCFDEEATSHFRLMLVSAKD